MQIDTCELGKQACWSALLERSAGAFLRVLRCVAEDERASCDQVGCFAQRSVLFTASRQTIA